MDVISVEAIPILRGNRWRTWAMKENDEFEYLLMKIKISCDIINELVGYLEYKFD